MLRWMTLVLFATVASIRDRECFSIPNRLLLAGALNGLILRFAEEGFDGIVAGIISSSIPLGLCGILFVLSMLGAGDIKLLMAIGIYMNPGQICQVIGLSFVIGAIWSFARLADRQVLMQRMEYLKHYYLRLKDGYLDPYVNMGIEMRNQRWLIHFSMPILLAVLYEIAFCSI